VKSNVAVPAELVSVADVDEKVPPPPPSDIVTTTDPLVIGLSVPTVKVDGLPAVPLAEPVSVTALAGAPKVPTAPY
jgi:hypothetical protein